MTWRERIAEARIRGCFTEEDGNAASSWSTCAVGEQAPQSLSSMEMLDFAKRMAAPIHIDAKECPGQQFVQAVLSNNFDRAERLLDEIEDTALRLKREQGGIYGY